MRRRYMQQFQNQKEEEKSVELDQNVNYMQEDMADVSVPTNIEVENIQNLNTKTKGKSRVEVKSEGVLISSLKFCGKSYAMVGESNWRPKTRPKNKLRLNMKNLLNPKLAKEKITVIDSDSSSQENLKEDEDLSKQVDSKIEDSVIENPSLMKDTVKEQSKNFSFKEDKSKKVPVAETEQHEEDDEEIIRKLNIPWLSEEVCSFQEGKFIDYDN